MTLKNIKELLQADVLCNEEMIERLEVCSTCGCDLMSDVLAFVKDQGMLLTGLVNAQAVRTAEMMDMKCVVFVRGKLPDRSILDLAKEREIVIMSTKLSMFNSCGILYANGLTGGSIN